MRRPDRAPTEYGRRAALFRDVRAPGDFSQNAVIRDASPDLFDRLCRDLRLRLYRGAQSTGDGAAWAVFRRGVPGYWGARCAATGALLVGLWFAPLAPATNPGPGPRAHISGFDVQALWDVVQTPFVVPGLALTFLVLGCLLGLLSRRYFWLLAQPTPDGRSDIWVFGTSWRHERSFEREFARFLDRAHALCDAAAAPDVVPHTGDPEPVDATPPGDAIGNETSDLRERRAVGVQRANDTDDAPDATVTPH